MVRIALLLLGLSGCDFVFQISPVELPQPAACGPYTDPQPLTITGITQPITDFSVDGPGAVAMVHIQNGVSKGLVPVGPDAWVLDDRYSGGLASSTIKGAHLTATAGDMFASDRSVLGTLFVTRYKYSAAMQKWNPVQAGADGVVATDPQIDVVAGNEVEIGDPPDNITSFVVVSLGPDSLGAYQLRFRVKVPAAIPGWQDGLSMEPINAAGNPGQGVVTADVLTLVYAEQFTGAASSDLFAAHRTSSSSPFLPGVRLGSLESDADEVEPWIDATCETIYFRRRMAGNQSDPGTIYVAHKR